MPNNIENIMPSHTQTNDDQDKPPAGHETVCSDTAPTASLTNRKERKCSVKCLLTALGRKKPLDERTETNLNRCLNLLDLTSLGVGSTLGLGLYVLAGQVASTKAGPAVILSFGLAALASAFSALCYAEFAARVPKAGSAYVYSYITVGEFVAFIIGWNLVLEYVIGASSVARGFSGYLRLVYEHAIQSVSSASTDDLDHSFNATTATRIPNPAANSSAFFTNLSNASSKSTNLANYGSELLAAAATSANLVAARGGGDATASASTIDSIVDYIVRYFDWPSIAIVVVITVFILFGVKESTNVTLIFTGVNLIVVLTVVLSSFRFLDLHNWQLLPEELPPGGPYGRGGFMPFGWSGVLAGSATCFFGFIGFDTIASSAEEAKNPKRNLPLSITLSLFISFIAYMLVAVVQTLLWPYYDQDKITILPFIFGKLGMPITYWVVLLGAAAGLASSQMGGMYPLPRVLYSMAQDKLIYAFLAHVNKKTRLPVRATIVGSIFIALLACLLDIQDLADMVSIGTLAAYSLVSISVLLVRYEFREDAVEDEMSNRKFTKLNTKQRQRLLDLLIKWSSADDADLNQPDKVTCFHSKILVALIVILGIVLDVLVLAILSTYKQAASNDQQHALLRMITGQQYMSLETVLVSGGCIVLVSLIAVVLMLSRLPSSKPAHSDMFMVPFVPTVPTMSILVNTFLMLNLSYLTWVRFSVWMAVGFFIYFTYGIWNSEGYVLRVASENKK